MRKILGASLLLASMAVAYGISGATLAQPGAAVDAQQSSVSLSSVEGPTVDGAARVSGGVLFFFHDDDEDDNTDDEDEDDGDDRDPPDHAGPPDDDDDDEQEDNDQDDDDQKDDDQGDEDHEDGTDAADGTDTAPPTVATPSPPPEPSSVTIDSLELPPARFDVSMAMRSNATLVAGGSVRIDVRVENTGLQDGTYDVAMLVDGRTVDTKTLAIDGGGAETRTFERRFDESGEYDLVVGNTSLGTVNVADVPPVRVTPESQGPPHSIAVVAATAPADWVRQGHRTTVRTTVVNVADRTATRTFTVTVDGQPVAVETVTLGPNEVSVHSIDFAAAAGAVAVDGVDAGRIDVGQGTQNVGLSTDDAAVAGTGIDLGVLFLVTMVGTVAGAAGHVVRRRG